MSDNNSRNQYNSDRQSKQQNFRYENAYNDQYDSQRQRYESQSGRPSEYRENSTYERRRMSPAARQRAIIRKKKKKFRKMLLIYIAVLVVILIIGSIAFSAYLSSYENSLPSHEAENIVKIYSSQEGIIDFLNDNADKTDLMGNVQEITQLYATNIAGKTISYKENNDFRPDTPSYDIMADGSTVAKVTLTQQGRKWAVSSIALSGYLPDSKTISVDVPSGSSVTVNGMLLDSSYIESTSVPEILADSLKFLSDPPQFDKYVISGLMSDPQISVTDPSGEALKLTSSGDSYTASPSADASFIASVQDRVTDTIDNYATYFIHMSFGLANYIVYGSDLYSYIFGSDEVDPIDTNLYNWEQIDHYEFAEKSADNYVKYTDDCFTVDVRYALDMYFTDPTFSDDNQTMDATWVFVIDPYDGSWCISDIISH